MRSTAGAPTAGGCRVESGPCGIPTPPPSSPVARHGVGGRARRRRPSSPRSCGPAPTSRSALPSSTCSRRPRCTSWAGLDGDEPGSCPCCSRPATTSTSTSPEASATSSTASLTAALGPDIRLAELLRDRLVAARLRDDDVVVMAAAGSSQPSAVADCERVAADLSSLLARDVTPAYLSAVAPTVADAVASARGSGGRVVVATYLLAPGFFADLAARAGADASSPPLLAAARAPAPALVDIVVGALRRPSRYARRAGEIRYTTHSAGARLKPRSRWRRSRCVCRPLSGCRVESEPTTSSSSAKVDATQRPTRPHRLVPRPRRRDVPHRRRRRALRTRTPMLEVMPAACHTDLMAVDEPTGSAAPCWRRGQLIRAYRHTIKTALNITRDRYDGTPESIIVNIGRAERPRFRAPDARPDPRHASPRWTTYPTRHTGWRGSAPNRPRHDASPQASRPAPARFDRASSSWAAVDETA